MLVRLWKNAHRQFKLSSPQQLSRHPSLEWLEDRTLLAARLVSDLVPGLVGSDPRFLMNANGFVAFSAVNPQTNNRGLWVSDGTADGTVLIHEGLSPAKTNSAIDFSPNVAVRFGANSDQWKSLLFFAANDGITGTEPWVSDGTVAGTVEVQNINPGPPPNNSSNPDFRTVVNGTVYFAAAEDGVNRELWRTKTLIDGTVTAERVPGVPPNLVLSSENFLTSANAKVFFAADDGVSGDEPWVFDTTTGLTTQVKDINPPGPVGNFGSNPLELTNVNGTLYFTADDGSTPGGRELWRSLDGTAANTTKVRHFQAGVPDFVQNLTYANGFLFFVVQDGTNEDLMMLDAKTASAAIPTINLVMSFPSTPANLTPVADTLFFTVDDGTNGREPWRTVPQAGGTFTAQIVRRTDGNNINPGPAGSFPQHLTAVVDTLFFSADDGTNGPELWRTIRLPDGTIAAELVRQTNGNLINPGPAGSSPADLVNVNGRLFFSADDGTHGRELWTFDNHQPAGRPFATVTVNVPLEDAVRQGQDQDTQSESSVLLSGSTVLVGYNDTGARVDANGNLRTHFTGVSRSTNGGATFVDTATLPDSASGDGGDPVLARDNISGTIYLATLQTVTMDPTRLGPTLQVFRSTNGGQTFNAPVSAVPAGAVALLDKPWITVDNFTGAGQGNVYLTTRDFEPGGGIFLSRSTDGGATWALGNGGLSLVGPGSQGAFVAVGPDHAVYVFWWDANAANQRILLRKSTDQGQTFGAAVVVGTLNTMGLNGDLGLGGFRTNAFPQAAVNPANANNIYVVYNDRPSAAGADRANVYFQQSTDGGATWTAARVRVNDDTGTNDQWFPTMAVSPNGANVGVFWYDRRLDSANNLIDRFGAIGTATASGVTFGTNFALTNVAFQPVVNVDPGVGNTYMGDYDQAVADNNFFYTTWGDNSGRNLAGGGTPVGGVTYVADTRFEADVRFAKIPVTGPTARVATTTTVAASVNPSLLNQVVTFTAIVSPQVGSGTPTGAVQFVIDAVKFGAPVTLTGGSASVSTATLVVGPHTVLAVYSGDANFLASTGSLRQSVQYNFIGFLPPLDRNIAFGLNRTIPIKWQLRDFNDTLITSLSAVTSLQVAQVLSGGGLGTPFNPTPSGGTGLHNDGSQYIFNWETTGLTAGTYEILLTLADGTLRTKVLQLSDNGSPAGLMIDGAGNTTTTTAGTLLGGDIDLYVDNSNGLFTFAELSAIQDAVAAVDAVIGTYGVTIIEVRDTGSANVILDTGSSSAVGGYADGVLGCTTDAGEITIIQGWSWYAGSDASVIGASQFDFQTVVTHELGHALGLGHSADAASVMNATLAPGVAKRALNTADLNVPDTNSGPGGLRAVLFPFREEALLSPALLARLARLDPSMQMKMPPAGADNFLVGESSIGKQSQATMPQGFGEGRASIGSALVPALHCRDGHESALLTALAEVGSSGDDADFSTKWWPDLRPSNLSCASW